MNATPEPDFQKYFASISQQYKCWWNFYILTDTLDKKSQGETGFSHSPFDFGLMVEKIVPRRSPSSKATRN
ncbi:hypothetical protein [Calothrix sp. 336/3]|uniref:hypothetical protein n=1 Tax=Calothrix sp. 336/3 TaxID=1337936 RepID=UPI00055565F8|nr:hypothetical protein [Calothrix sp. 336/3]